MESVTLENGGGKTTIHGMWYLSLKYRGVIRLGQFDSAQMNLLFCLIRSFLGTISRDNDLAEPAFDIVNLDNQLKKVEISTEFRDPIYLTESESGPIEINGKNYDTVPFDLWVAEKIAIDCGIK